MNTKFKTRRQKIRFKIRKKIKGTPEKPRVAIYRSNTQIYAQIIDDVNNKTLLSASSRDKVVAEKISSVKGKVEKSKLVGKELAEMAKAKNIGQVVFDRGGYLFHGRVKAVADGAREGGLKF